MVDFPGIGIADQTNLEDRWFQAFSMKGFVLFLTALSWRSISVIWLRTPGGSTPATFPDREQNHSQPDGWATIPWPAGRVASRLELASAPATSLHDSQPAWQRYSKSTASGHDLDPKDFLLSWHFDGVRVIIDHYGRNLICFDHLVLILSSSSLSLLHWVALLASWADCKGLGIVFSLLLCIGNPVTSPPSCFSQACQLLHRWSGARKRTTLPALAVTVWHC